MNLAQSFKDAHARFLMKEDGARLRDYLHHGVWPADVDKYIHEMESGDPTQTMVKKYGTVHEGLKSSVYFGHRIKVAAQDARKGINNVCNPMFPEMHTWSSGKQKSSFLQEIRDKVYQDDGRSNASAEKETIREDLF
jgi:hypothetical protein